MAPMATPDAKTIQATGLEMIGVSPHRQQKTCAATNMARFRSSFSCCPDACRQLFHDLRSLVRPNIMYFLLALFWMTTYETESNMASLFNLDEKTVRKWCWEYVQSIESLALEKVSWKWVDASSGRGETFIVSVDGVHCRINEPRTRPSASWYSHKFHQPGLAYEIGISIWESKLVWINGPFPAATSDLTILRKPNGLLSKVPAGKRLIADSGYTGEAAVCSTRNYFDTPEVKKFKKRSRARHEIFNGRIKTRKILVEPFRHGVDKHKSVFVAACILAQYDMDNGHPLFSV